MKRRTVFLIALASLAALAVAVLPWSIAANPAAREVASDIKALTGLRLSSNERVTIALLPIPRIKIEDVTLAAPDGEAVVKAGQLRGELALWPLIRGRIELSKVTLIEPDIDLTGIGDPVSAWQRTLALLAHEIKTGKTVSRRTHIGQLVIIGGKLTLRGTGGKEFIRNASVIVRWPGASRSISISGSLVWRGETAKFALSDLTPALLAVGKASDLTFSASTENGSLSFSGEAMREDGLHLQGKVDFQTVALRRVDRWLNLKLPGVEAIGQMTLSGPLSLNDHAFSFASVHLTLGSDALDGTLTGRFDNGKFLLSGTLAADTLNLTGFAAPFIPSVTSYGTWTTNTINSTRLRDNDIDVRISAAKAQVRRFAMEDLGAGIILHDGRLEVLLSRTKAYGGSLHGRFIAKPGENGLDVKLQADAERVNVATLLGDAGFQRRIGGLGTGEVALETNGASFAELMRNMDGKASFLVKQGELTGVDLAEAAQRTETTPLSVPLDWKSGRTLFSRMTGTLAIKSGTAALYDGLLTASGFQAHLNGTIGIWDRNLALKGHVMSADARPGSDLPFEIVGGWDDPALNLDVQALIRRSGAAAPLLGISRAVTIDPVDKTAP